MPKGSEPAGAPSAQQTSSTTKTAPAAIPPAASVPQSGQATAFDDARVSMIDPAVAMSSVSPVQQVCMVQLALDA